MVLMVRSIGMTLTLVQKLFFDLLMLLSTFAVYCVEGKTSHSKEMTLYKQKEDKVRNDLIPTHLVLVSTMDGSILGVDRYNGTIHWTLKGGPESALIKSTSKFETNKASRDHSSSDEDAENLFINEITTDPDDSDDLYEDPEYNMDSANDEEEEDEGDIYYIIEPQDGGIIYLYADGRPLEVNATFTIIESTNNVL